MVATIRSYVDFEHHGAVVFGQELTDFPSDPKPNQQVLINGILWLYSTVNGVLTWLPLNNKKNAYTHTQGAASNEWIVNHGMGTQDFLIGVYDANNQPMSASGITTVTNDGFHLTFTEAVTGRAVIFFNTESFAPTVTAQNVAADSLNVNNGAVTADSSGLYVNGNPVVATNSSGAVDLGTL